MKLGDVLTLIIKVIMNDNFNKHIINTEIDKIEVYDDYIKIIFNDEELLPRIINKKGIVKYVR